MIGFRYGKFRTKTRRLDIGIVCNSGKYILGSKVIIGNQISEFIFALFHILYFGFKFTLIQQ